MDETPPTRRKPPAAAPGRIVALAIALALVVKSCFVDLAFVQGGSMEPSLSQGDVVLVARCAYGLRIPIASVYALRWRTPAQDELVAADGPRGRIVKRVFAVGPCALAVSGGGIARPDGARVPSAAGSEATGSIAVPAGTVFLVGTNWFESVDSRSYGPLPIEKVIGTVLPFGE